jgi:hypothetical protein
MKQVTVKSRGALVVRPGYEVGYGKPPVATRFQKGRSGNPAGRPKGSKNKLPALNEERLKTIVIEEAYRTVTLREGEKTITVPIAQAVIRALAVNAVKGQHRAQRLFAQLLAATESANSALATEYLHRALDYKLAWERELKRRKDRHHQPAGPDSSPRPCHHRHPQRHGPHRRADDQGGKGRVRLLPQREAQAAGKRRCPSRRA